MSILVPLILATLAIIVPGILLSLALLKKTGIPMFEIVTIGFLFGMIFPPTLTWLEAYLIPYVHFFSFSANLYTLNVLLLTVIGFVLCLWQRAFDFSNFSRVTKGGTSRNIARDVDNDYRSRIKKLRDTITSLGTDLELIKKHEKEESDLMRRHQEELELLGNAGEEEKRKIKESHIQQERRLFEEHESEERTLLNESGMKTGPVSFQLNWVWIVLLMLMLVTFLTRMANIGVAPTYFEFDPYFDMISTSYILVHGYQIPLDHSAWPALNGTNHVLEPIVPYLEAYWYDISVPAVSSNTVPISAVPISSYNASTVFTPSNNYVNINWLSLISSVYPPIAAALLVFVVFMFLYHEYGEIPGIIGAVLATAMPALITTFISGEQLVEPFGITMMFFFFAAYALAVKYPKEWRFAALAGIAFAANFLGAHYYTVTAGVLGAYIILQGIVNILRNEDSRDFYISNAIVIGVIVLFYIPYSPYNSTLTNRIPLILHFIPIIVGLPLFALVIVFLMEFLIKYLIAQKKISKSWTNSAAIMAAALIIIALLILFTPLGNPFQKYIQLSVHFTTPSSALFMTVQEYAPTGWNFDFGQNGFGIIGNNIFGISLLVWPVLIAFVLLEGYAIYERNSKTSILVGATVIPLAVAGMSEIKYLPHFGVGYILAICAIVGELLILLKIKNTEREKNFLYGFVLVAILLSAMAALFQPSQLISVIILPVVVTVICAMLLLFVDVTKITKEYGTYFIMLFILVIAIMSFELIPSVTNVIQSWYGYTPSCSTISNSSSALGADLFCNQVPPYWLKATAWMRAYVGPYAPRILSWWDYGDWINWFGNSNAVLRGDNAQATEDYATAAQFILGPKDGYNATTLAHSMDAEQAKYVLFDDQLVPKWAALDFLGCIDVNQTSYADALKNGIGTSQCELTHDPIYGFLPINPGINNYCPSTNSSNIAIKVEAVIGGAEPTNITYCAQESYLYSPTATYIPLDSLNGTKTNAYLLPYYYGGTYAEQSGDYASFLVVYAANDTNGTVSNPPTLFYDSNFYSGFFLGRLKGFTLAYPRNFSGTNFINGTNKIMILQVDNYTGGNPPVSPKASWISNNYSMPG